MPPEIESKEGAAELPTEIELGGAKYNPKELLDAQTNWKAHENDFKDLPNLKQDREALTALQEIIQSDPALANDIRVRYGKKLAGIPLTPTERKAEEAGPSPEPEAGKGAKKPETVALPQEYLDRMERLEQSTSSVLTAESQRIFRENLSSFQTKFPAFKDADRMQELYKAGRDLAVAKMGELVSMGTRPEEAWPMAQGFVSNMSHEQIMMNTPMRKYYEEEVLKQAGGRPSLPGGIGTGAERLQDGRPGPTPELDKQLRQKIAAAGMDQDKRIAAIEEWATKTGRHPLELYGFDKSTAEQLAPV